MQNLSKVELDKSNSEFEKLLAEDLKDRKFTGAVNFKLPISRLKKSDNKLIKHPFYNFGKKDAHI